MTGRNVEQWLGRCHMHETKDHGFYVIVNKRPQRKECFVLQTRSCVPTGNDAQLSCLRYPRA